MALPRVADPVPIGGRGRMAWRGLMLLATVVLFLWGAATTVSAQAPTFGMRPQEAGRAYFEYSVAAGEAVEDVLVLNNPNDVPLSLHIAPVRGKTMAAGGITYVQEASGPAQWITLSNAGLVEVPAQASLRLPFEVAVPPGTPPGEYVAGFLAAPASPAAEEPLQVAESDTKSSLQVVVVSQVAVAVVITVPEASRCEAAISSLQSTSEDGRWQFGIGMQNTGNVHFRATGEVIARPVGSAEPVAQGPFNVGYFIPGDAIEYPLALEPYPTAGDYEVEVRLASDCGFETSFVQPVSISRESVRQAAAEAEAREVTATVADEVAKMQAQAELIRAVTLLVVVITGLLVVAVVLVVVLKRRKSAVPPDDA